MAAPVTSGDPAAAVRYARGQSIGARDYQEDSVRLKAEGAGVLAIVADGMGGHAAGDVASKAAADGFLTGFGGRPASSVDDRLALGLKAGNQAIADALDAGRGGAGMGCTVSAVFADADRVSWVSVGDSPIFLWSKGRLERISEDHSMAPVLDEMARKGVISWEEADNDPDRHALRSAVRGQAIELSDQGSVDFPPDGVVLIASDGLETIDDAEIAAITAARSGDPDALVADLLSAVIARAAPEQDNVSVIAIARNAARLAGPAPAAGGSERRSGAGPNWRIPAAMGLVAVILLAVALAFVMSGQA